MVKKPPQPLLFLRYLRGVRPEIAELQPSHLDERHKVKSVPYKRSRNMGCTSALGSTKSGKEQFI